jgi:hypothetical protein
MLPISRGGSRTNPRNSRSLVAIIKHRPFMSYFSFLFVVWILVFLRTDGPVEAGSPKTSPIEQVNPQIKYNSTFHPESGIPFSKKNLKNLIKLYSTIIIAYINIIASGKLIVLK